MQAHKIVQVDLTTFMALFVRVHYIKPRGWKLANLSNPICFFGSRFVLLLQLCVSLQKCGRCSGLMVYSALGSGASSPDSSHGTLLYSWARHFPSQCLSPHKCISGYWQMGNSAMDQHPIQDLFHKLLSKWQAQDILMPTCKIMLKWLLNIN